MKFEELRDTLDIDAKRLYQQGWKAKTDIAVDDVIAFVTPLTVPNRRWTPEKADKAKTLLSSFSGVLSEQSQNPEPKLMPELSPKPNHEPEPKPEPKPKPKPSPSPEPSPNPNPEPSKNVVYGKPMVLLIMVSGVLGFVFQNYHTYCFVKVSMGSEHLLVTTIGALSIDLVALTLTLTSKRNEWLFASFFVHLVMNTAYHDLTKTLKYNTFIVSVISAGCVLAYSDIFTNYIKSRSDV